MPKISQLSSDSSPATADSLAGVQASGPTTQRFTLSNLIAFFWKLANIPSGGTSPITRDSESQVNFSVANTGVWSGDAYGSTKNASMTALTCYINGRRIQITAVTARTFTASKDTYIDVLDNGDGTGILVYTEVTNGAAAPVLAANSLRIGKIVTGASNIAAASSVVQWGVDSLGNYIYNTSATAAVISILTNGGNAGGTFYYRNQSGVKELWGTTASVIGAAAPSTFQITFPASFFNSVISGLLTLGGNNTANGQAVNIAGSGLTTALLQLTVQAASTTSAEPVQVYVRGF